MPVRFGTDGIRGVANADLSVEVAVAVGRALAVACREGVLGPPRPRPQVVVGRDTRPSGTLLEAGVVAGLCSAGADVLLAGIVPTPGVAFLTADLGADAGVVLSASHNPPQDNGIKVFGPGGWKLTELQEEAIERLVGRAGSLPVGADVGRARRLADAEERYLEHLVSSTRSSLRGLRVVVDCAHGAAYRASPLALERLGAEVVPLHAAPEGERINVGCGATHPEVVAAAARRLGAVGLTHDGDGDRVLAADEEGNVVDGDAIIALLASRLRRRGKLRGGAIAVTVMSNQALRRWCAAEGIRLVETPVGDRYVLGAMREQGLVLGGEQSGHVIRLDLATTGDGILTAIGLLEVVAESGRLADAVPFRPLPQVLVNVPLGAGGPVELGDAVARAVEQAQRELGESGRVLVRPSGTEPLVRVMVEAPSERRAREIAARLAAAVEREIGAG